MASWGGVTRLCLQYILPIHPPAWGAEGGWEVGGRVCLSVESPGAEQSRRFKETLRGTAHKTLDLNRRDREGHKFKTFDGIYVDNNCCVCVCVREQLNWSDCTTNFFFLKHINK